MQDKGHAISVQHLLNFASVKRSLDKTKERGEEDENEKEREGIDPPPPPHTTSFPASFSHYTDQVTNYRASSHGGQITTTATEVKSMGTLPQRQEVTTQLSSLLTPQHLILHPYDISSESVSQDIALLKWDCLLCTLVYL